MKKELTENQKIRIGNLEKIQYSSSLVGSVIGVVYAKKTGGGFWRYLGYWFAGSLVLGLATSLVVTPFKNKILKEADSNTDSENNNQ